MFHAALGLARVYDPRQDGNTDLLYIDDGRVDFALREKIIREARYSLDVISMSQTADGAGLRILRSLRGAQLRGVRVRYIFDSLASTFEGDWVGHSSAALVDSSLPCPGNVVCVTPVQKWTQGLSFDDFIHEKILIADAGTEYERILVGGRNHTQKGLFFIDSSFVIRPLDAKAPYLGTDVKALYERFWSMLRGAFGSVRPQPVSSGTMSRLENGPVPELVTEERERRELRALSRLLDARPTADDVLAPQQFRPRTTQVVSNDLFEQLLTDGSPGRSIHARRNMRQDIVDTAVRLVDNAQDVDFTSYVVALPERLEASVQRLLQRDGHVRYFTNGREAHRTLIPGGIAVDYSFLQAERLLAHGNFSLYLLDHGIINRMVGHRREYRMVHRKHLRAGNWCLFGSDNFTPSSALKNDEFSIAVEDPRLAEFFKQLTRRESFLFDRLTADRLNVARLGRPWYSPLCVNSIVRNVY